MSSHVPSILIYAAISTSCVAMAQDKYQAAVTLDAQASLKTAKDLRARGDLRKAVVTLSELTHEQPTYFAAQYNLGLTLADAGKTREAIEALERAKAIREKEKLPDATIYNSLGWAYMLDGKFAAAETSFEDAKRHENLLSRESKARLYNNLGWLYMNTGKFDLAREALTTAEKVHGSEFAGRNIQALEKFEQNKSIAKVPLPTRAVVDK